MRYLIASLALVACLLMEGCPANPVKEAVSVEQKSYAVYGTFVIFEEIGAKVATGASTPQKVKVAIADADGRAKPVMDALLAGVKEVEVARAQLKAGTTTQEKVDIAIANLSTWLLQGEPLVNNLVAAVKGGG